MCKKNISLKVVEMSNVIVAKFGINYKMKIEHMIP
jgi:hypothetical protein